MLSPSPELGIFDIIVGFFKQETQDSPRARLTCEGAAHLKSLVSLGGHIASGLCPQDDRGGQQTLSGEGKDTRR